MYFRKSIKHVLLPACQEINEDAPTGKAKGQKHGRIDRPASALSLAYNALVLVAFTDGFGSLRLRFFIAQHGAARQLDLIAFFADTLDHYLLAFF